MGILSKVLFTIVIFYTVQVSRKPDVMEEIAALESSLA